MKTYLVYVRVSTARQSVQGVSLQEQRRAITQYAAHHRLYVSEWREEIETAAKRGRPVFRDAVRWLKSGRDRGLIIHKIDRGARNLRDWADLGELIDQGFEVRIAHEDLDLGTRGGRLAADIQAVIAADYIRNLREEIRKGITGRLEQGIFPFGAPIGYRNNGGGVAKTPDPVLAALVVYAFERYASGEVTLRTLAGELRQRGWPRSGSANCLAYMLRNEFYAGTCIVRGKHHPGIHQPLISPELFARRSEPSDGLIDRGPSTTFATECASSARAAACSPANNRRAMSTTAAIGARACRSGRNGLIQRAKQLGPSS